MSQPAPARAPGRGRFSRRGLFLENFRRKVGVLSLPVVLAALLPMVVLPPHAMALPQGGQVVAGQVTSVFNGTQLTLDQASRAAIMNWQSFGIAPNEFVRILQQGPDAVLLARVTGGDPSQLLGRLQADGKLFLINPKGVLVGPGAVIDTAAFLASTLDVADADFLKGGPLTFQGDHAAGVVNLGRITAREGNVLLLAHTVKNDGEIAAPRGAAGLAAGTEVYLASPDAPAFVVRANLPSTTETTGIDNAGLITAAQVQLEAAGGSLFDLAVNQSGTIRATGVEHLPDGRVMLTASGGNVLVSGALAAQDAGGAGGEILIGGDYQGKNAAIANAARTQVTATATLEADAASTTGDGGRIIVWADDATRYAGHLSARAGVSGGDGGFAEVSGKRTLGFHGTADLRAPAGRSGSLLLDPDNITIVAGAGTVPDGLADRNWFSGEDPGDQTVGADIITDLLATGSVFLQASESLTVDAPIIVTGSTDPDASLALQAPEITINESISLAAVPSSDLDLFYAGGGAGTTLTTAPGATISASRIRVSQFPIVALNGAVQTGELQYLRLGGPATSFQATNPGNAIAKLFINSDPADPEPVHFTGNLAIHSDSAMVAAAMVGSANNVTLSAGGDLTLVDDELDEAVITASGVTKLASTGGVLINEAGDDLLAGSGRRLLYTSTTASGSGFDLGGLTGYTRFSGVAFPNDPQTGVSQVLYRLDGLLTITADAKSKTYGATDPTFTASYTGGTASDLSTLPSFTLQEGAVSNVGTYTIVPSGAVSAGYHDLAYANGAFTIDPATLTYVANTATRTTVGSDPVFSGTVTGFMNCESIASATTGTLTFSTTANAASAPGVYAITGSGLTALNGNYVFAQAPGNATAFSITQAGLLVVTADSFIKTYGQPDPTFTATYSGGTVGDLTVLPSFSIAEGAHTNVGTYTIVPAGAASSTHELSYQNGTLTIDPALLTYVAHSASRAVGASDPAFTGTVTGFVNGDSLGSATTGTLAFSTSATAASPAGAYALTGSGLTANHGNYVFAQATGNATAFTIHPAALLTIMANDFIKTFGQPDPVFTASYTGGTVADLTTLPSFSILQGEHVNVGTYTIVPSGAASATHSLSYVNGTLRIDPALLTYVADPATRLYGDANPAFSGTVTGFVNGDTLASATTGTLTFTSPATPASNAGSHAIRGGGLTANHGNYVFQDALANFSALAINQAPLTVTFADATRVYGAPNPAFSATFSGLRNGDTAASLTGFTLGSNAQAGSPVGTYQIAGGGTLTNYALTVNPGTLTITPAPLTLTVNSGSFTYGTDIPPALTYTVSGLVGGDPASVLSGVQFDTAAFAALPPGEHLVQPSVLGTARNYSVATVVPGVFTVARKPVLITANNQTSLVGIIPPLGGAAGITPIAGGPQFTVGASVWRQTPAAGGGFELTPYLLTRHSPPGEYVLVPEIVPAPGTTLAEIERYYTFTPINGRLKLDPVPADMVVLTQTFDPNAELIITIDGEINPAEDFTQGIKSLDLSGSSSRVTIHQMGDPLSVTQWGRVLLDSGDVVMGGLRSLVGTYDTGRKDAKGNPILGPRFDNAKYSEEEIEVLAAVWFGHLSAAQLAERMATDATVRNLVMPLIVGDLTAAVTSGRPLTQAQSILAGRVAATINTQRANLKVKLAELHEEHIATKIAAGTNNPFALKTMPDIAMTAQQAVAEQTIAMAIGGAVGGVVGSAGVGVTMIPSVAAAIFPFANLSKAGIAAGGAAGAAGGAAAGVFATAVGAIVIGVVAGVMVAQEQANINAYDAALQRANTPVSSSLQGLDLRGDDIVKSEFYTAFMATVLESGFK